MLVEVKRALGGVVVNGLTDEPGVGTGRWTSRRAWRGGVVGFLTANPSSGF